MTRSTREDANPDVGDKPLKAPHERDESAGAMAPGADRESGKRAYDDLAAGRTDTDLRGSAQQIIERAHQADAEADGKHEDAEGKPARGEDPPIARQAPDPAKE